MFCACVIQSGGGHLAALCIAEGQNARVVGLNGELVEVAEIELSIARCNGSGDDVTLRSGNIHHAAHGTIGADRDDLAVVRFYRVEPVIKLGHAVERSVRLEVGSVRVFHQMRLDELAEVGNKFPSPRLGVDAVKAARPGVAVRAPGACHQGIKVPIHEPQVGNAHVVAHGIDR